MEFYSLGVLWKLNASDVGLGASSFYGHSQLIPAGDCTVPSYVMSVEGDVCFLSNPVVSGGFVYVYSLDGFLMQFDEDDLSYPGGLVASFDTSPGAFPSTQYSFGSPLVINGSVFFSAYGFLYELNASNVSQLIKSVDFGNVFGNGHIVSAGDYVYTTEDGDGVSCCVVRQFGLSNISDELSNFSCGCGDTVAYSPVVYGNYLFVQTMNGLYQLNAENVSELVNFNSVLDLDIYDYMTFYQRQTSPAIFEDGNVVFTVADNGLYRLDAGNVSVIYESVFSDSFGEPLVSGGFVYVYSLDGFLMQFDEDDSTCRSIDYQEL